MRQAACHILVILLTAFLQQLSAQTQQVTIKVVNEKKEPVAFASIRVSLRNDSLRTWNRVADSTGKAFVQLEKGQYKVSITAVNYLPLEKNMAFSGNNIFWQFTATPAGKDLQGVVVTSKKPLMRQEDDKTIVEPENLVAASTNGYEVIEKTPGLFVDQDGNIYISSLSPAAVQINGRDMRMSAADMASLLKSLPPNAISKIEIVRTPSARYDASGTGGVVNVVLKKGIKIGLTGSLNAGFQQGNYGSQFAGINLNDNNGKRSSYFNFNAGNRNGYERIRTDRWFAADSLLTQDAFTVYPGNSIYSALGSTWELSKKWELTYDAHLNYNGYDNRSENSNRIYKSGGTALTNSLNTVFNQGHSLSLGTGFESKYRIDSAGSEWTNDTYYSRIWGSGEQDYGSQYLLPVIPGSGGDGNTESKRHYFTGRSDLKLKMKKKFTLESGIQSTLQDFRNQALFNKTVNGASSPDSRRTNTFRYDENINSFYLQGSKTFGKNWVIKLGSRLENTNMNGKQTVPGDTSFSIHRTDLFPYVYLSKPVMKIAGYELRAYLVYRRSIRRPGYEQLNPFRRYVDEFLTETGNPALRPQFTQNYEANISVDERPLLAVGVNETKDIFTNVVYQSDTGRSQAYRTYDNLGRNKEWYLRGLGAIPPGGRYFFVLGAQYNHNFYDGLYENKPLSFKRGSWTFFTYQTFRIDKRSVFTLNGFLRLKGQQQFYELSQFGMLNASINRRFLKEKLVLTLSLSDMFATNKNDFALNQGSVKASGFRQSDTRRVGLNLRYNFGLRKKEENKNFLNSEVPEGNRP